MSRIARVALGSVVLAATVGCVPLPGGHEVSRRQVASKRGDDTLVAQDGSYCRVPRGAFEKAEVGRDYTCIWCVSDSPRPSGRSLPGRNP